MTDVEQREAARQFYYKWKGRGREDEDARSYWIDFLQDVLGVDHVTDRVEFEKKVVGKDGNTKRIDVYIPETRVLIEQKSLGLPLDKPQAGHKGKTPLEQAQEYDDGLRFEEKSRWIITSNFEEIWIYDMNVKPLKPIVVKLDELPTKYRQFDFLVNKQTKKITEEMQLSLAAGDLVGKLYDAFLKQYKDPENPESLKSLNKLCVRLVFCLFAEDAGLFDKHLQFHDYLEQYRTKDMRRALIALFETLNTPYDKRDDYLDEDLKAFPYVNGGLFEDEKIEVPNFTDEIRKLLLEDASAGFNWSDISPTIFGAVFESTLNPETRRSGGMHYTSVENIHKVIDPLFLDGLRAELQEIKQAPTAGGSRTKRMQAFQEKLASLTFLDPAAGSGNFLTESYLSLRRMENEIIRELNGLMEGQMMLDDMGNEALGVKVSINQFYGIEINDFAVAVAKTAMWIAEAQMLRETQSAVNLSQDFLPLKTNVNIVEGNALRIDWNDVVPKEKLNYIMGNPPFVGYSLQSREQKEDILSIYVDEKGKSYKTAGKIDYVSGWYFKAAQLMQGTSVRAAFVSTNSITQGEQVAGVWKPLYERFGIHIDFAYRTFRWDSEASLKAHVHCVIVGFSCVNKDNEYRIIEGDSTVVATEISPYLIDGPIIFVEARRKPICDIPPIINGGKPAEGGFLILSQEETTVLQREDSVAAQFLRPYMMGVDFINRKPRTCLWLVGANPKTIKSSPELLKRIEKVRQFRLSSQKEATRKSADTPTLFQEVKECKTNYVAIPVVSSQRRRYIPMDYLSPEIIAGNKLFFMENASLFHFGVITSNVHMAWMRTVAGRLKSDYSYSNTVVYNNFPWPEPTPEQRAKIEQTAQAILDARALYPDSSLADLYDELTMPPELRKAHQANDRAVMAAYGFPVRKDFTEADCVAALMKLYQEKTQA